MGRAPATPSIFIKSMSTLYDSEPPWSEAPDPLPWSGRLAAGQAHGRENWPKAYLGITLPRRLRRRRHRLQSTYGPGDHKGHIPGTHVHHMAKKSVTLLCLAGVTALRPTLGMLGLPKPGVPRRMPRRTRTYGYSYYNFKYLCSLVPTVRRSSAVVHTLIVGF